MLKQRRLFRVFNLDDEYDTVEAAYAKEQDNGVAFYGPDDELVGWFLKDLMRGFCAVPEGEIA